MHTLKTPVTDPEYDQVDYWSKRLHKTKRQIVREALGDFFTRQKNIERGLDIIYIRSKHIQQNKLDLD